MASLRKILRRAEKSVKEAVVKAAPALPVVLGPAVGAVAGVALGKVLEKKPRPSPAEVAGAGASPIMDFSSMGDGSGGGANFVASAGSAPAGISKPLQVFAAGEPGAGPSPALLIGGAVAVVALVMFARKG